MKIRPLMVLLVVISVLAIMPTAAMAFSGSSGEPGANCPELPSGDRYSYNPAPWMGNITLSCEDVVEGDCGKLLFTANEGLIQVGSQGAIIATFEGAAWAGTTIKAEFDDYTARSIVKT